MNEKINTEQNKVENIKLLASQRYLYSSAKKIMSLQIFFSVVLVTIMSIAVLIFNEKYIFNIKYDLSAHSALLSIIVTLLNPIFFVPMIKKRKELASKIQELFDTKVLHIKWNEINIGELPNNEDIKIYYDEYKKDSNLSELENWYSEKIDEVPLHIGRIICQRSNLWWDISLRKKYIRNLLFIVCFFIVIIVSIGIFSNPSFNSVISNIFTPLLPIFLFCIEQYKANKDSICNLENLRKELHSLWQRIINGNDNFDEIEIMSRKIQDEIYKNRKDNQLVFDWIYQISKSKDEEIMGDSVDMMISEYNRFLT